MKKHTLSKLEVLQYALEGACIRCGIYTGALSDSELAALQQDIAELQRRLKLVRIANQRKGGGLTQCDMHEDESY
jgi:hypothetical protein